MSDINSTFILAFTSLLLGTIGIFIKYCLKSKCENLNCCFGLLKIKRRVDLEVQEELEQIKTLGKIQEDDIEKQTIK